MSKEHIGIPKLTLIFMDILHAVVDLGLGLPEHLHVLLVVFVLVEGSVDRYNMVSIEARKEQRSDMLLTVCWQQWLGTAASSSGSTRYSNSYFFESFE